MDWGGEGTAAGQSRWNWGGRSNEIHRGAARLGGRSVRPAHLDVRTVWGSEITWKAGIWEEC